MRRILPAIVPSILQSRDHRLDSAKILVIAALLLRQQRVHGMMEVIAPLRVESVAAMSSIEEQPRVVQIAFCNELDGPPQLLRELVGRFLEFCQEMLGAEIEDAVDSIQAQGIKVVVFEPIQRIFAEESSHVVAAGTVEIESLTPRGSITIGEIGSECIKVVAFRPEMVVNHIQDGG